ncbi:MAG: hypothetical protein Q8N81_05195 [bacterium]|nr:hypothetical protein [bacterium]
MAKIRLEKKEDLERIVDAIEDGIARRYGFTHPYMIPAGFKETLQEILQEVFETPEADLSRWLKESCP